MILIVEGIDRVGKSTLVEKLKKMVGFYPYHNDTNFKVEVMDNDNETDKLLKMLLICDASDPLIVFDRFHFRHAEKCGKRTGRRYGKKFRRQKQDLHRIPR